jgi:hypothetical protein
MDTNNPHNLLLIGDIRRQALASSLLEAFLEAAPQIIIQGVFLSLFSIDWQWQNHNNWWINYRGNNVKTI